MAFDGKEGSPIDVETASSWTSTFRHTHDGTTGHFFGRDILLKMLDQTDAMGIRFYYGVDQEGQRQLLAVAADAAQNDQWEGENIVADDSCSCPPWNSSANPLNS